MGLPGVDHSSEPRVGMEWQRPSSQDLNFGAVRAMELCEHIPRGPPVSWSPRLVLMWTGSGNRLGSNATFPTP